MAQASFCYGRHASVTLRTRRSALHSFRTPVLTRVVFPRVATNWILGTSATQTRTLSSSPSLYKGRSEEGQVPGGPIPLTIQLPGILKPQGIHAEGHFVWEIVDAIITKFKQLFSGVDPNHVQLFKLDGSTSTPLDHTQTLNEAGIHAGTKLVVEIMGRADPWVLPEPQPVTLTCVGDTDMYRTSVVKRDGRLWPFFLTLTSYQQLVEFVQEVPSPDPQVLVLSGPVKSGKTDVLHLVLPSIIAREYSASKRRPVIVRFTFDLRQGPDMAALSLLEYAKDAAAALGIPVQIDYAPGWALRNIHYTLGGLADVIAKMHAELWLLIDECQAPLLNGLTFADGQLWMSALKRILAAISPVGRVAWAGSAMVTFLNHARMVPTNGFMLMARIRFVRLGGTPSAGAAIAMATALGQSYAESQAWPELVRQHMATGTFVQKLDSAASYGLLSARPALVSHVLELMGSARTGSVDEMVDLAVAEAAVKLRDESRNDFTIALLQLEMSPGITRGLFELAQGNCRSLDDLQLGLTATKMLSLLCEEPSVGSTDNPTLLPPYATFVKEYLNEDGDIIVRWAGRENELGDKLRGILNFFSETYADQHFASVHLAKISAAVVESLRSNGIGVKNIANGRVCAIGGASDISEVPALFALLHDSANSRLAVEHARKLSDAKTLRPYSLAIGFHVLRWARNVASHHRWAADVLTKKGLSVTVLDAAARAAVVAVCGVREDAGFVFRLDEKCTPERKQVRARPGGHYR